MHTEPTKLKRWLILFNVAISVFMATLDGSIVNIALPVISNKLTVSISSIQWVVTSYMLTISVLLLIWGKISDMFGKKKIFAFGFIIFTIGSGLCGLSNSLNMLVLSRILQGIGASSLMALSQGIVSSTFPANERGKALGIIGTTVALGSLFGPSLGGLLVHIAGWQYIFLVNIPIGIIGTILTFVIIPDVHIVSTNNTFDYKGSAMFTTSIIMLFLGLLLLQDMSISISLFVPMIIISLILLFFFIKYEQRISNPLINLKLFHNPVFLLGTCSSFLTFIATFAIIMFIPFYLQYILKLDPLQSGLLISAYPLTTAFVAPISGWLSDKITYRPLTVTGLTISTLILFILTFLSSTTPHIVIAILMGFLGIGTALFQSPNNSSVMGAVPRDQLGIAGGINAFFRNLGMVSGVTLSVLIFTYTAQISISSFSQDNSSIDVLSFMKGFKLVMLFAAITCLISTFVSISRAFGTTTKNKMAA